MLAKGGNPFHGKRFAQAAPERLSFISRAVNGEAGPSSALHVET